eukprot:CAMPEP_0170528266 /NCGR_PEP_ID=MMETSP0209-20121228/13770_1 /TAXON_ID=665100 ORGANISM="Litonotus pictus, Strain P1" /NCGR_SAMPLE_ID=MMETSP0209 /ASSEMBLY_ACC=CAM_ASM_000301 /LENGTH=442 /DNA_ID=CAMNT_0010819365 /DNA_START=1087 /DNA_END=2412 /DNA_ORIENTATION=+
MNLIKEITRNSMMQILANENQGNPQNKDESQAKLNPSNSIRIKEEDIEENNLKSFEDLPFYIAEFLDCYIEYEGELNKQYEFKEKDAQNNELVKTFMKSNKSKKPSPRKKHDSLDNEDQIVHNKKDEEDRLGKNQVNSSLDRDNPEKKISKLGQALVRRSFNDNEEVKYEGKRGSIDISDRFGTGNLFNKRLNNSYNSDYYKKAYIHYFNNTSKLSAFRIPENESYSVNRPHYQANNNTFNHTPLNNNLNNILEEDKALNQDSERENKADNKMDISPLKNGKKYFEDNSKFNSKKNTKSIINNSDSLIVSPFFIKTISHNMDGSPLNPSKLSPDRRTSNNPNNQDMVIRYNHPRDEDEDKSDFSDINLKPKAKNTDNLSYYTVLNSHNYSTNNVNNEKGLYSGKLVNQTDHRKVNNQESSKKDHYEKSYFQEERSLAGMSNK